MDMNADGIDKNATHSNAIVDTEPWNTLQLPLQLCGAVSRLSEVPENLNCVSQIRAHAKPWQARALQGCPRPR